MKTLIILIGCTIANIVNADWQTIGDYDVNLATGEFWNQKAAIGGNLNNDLSIASLQTNATIELIDELNNSNELAIIDEPVSLYARRTTRSELFNYVCTFFHVDLNGYECDNVRKIAMATIGMIVFRTSKGEQVKIQGFGNFGLRKQNARAGRNPHTGEPVQIPAMRRVTWHPTPQYACTIDLDGGADSRSICDGVTRDPEYLLKLVGTDLKSGQNDEGFTATTNLDPPPPVVRVTTTIDPAKGTISPSNDYYAGSKMTLNVLPKAGWKFTGWTNSQCANGIAPNTPITCTPIFVKLNRLTFNIVGNGIVRDENYNQITELYVETGGIVKINPLAGTGYKNGMPTFSPAPCSYSFTMPANDLVCTATFVKI